MKRPRRRQQPASAPAPADEYTWELIRPLQACMSPYDHDLLLDFTMSSRVPAVALCPSCGQRYGIAVLPR